MATFDDFVIPTSEWELKLPPEVFKVAKQFSKTERIVVGNSRTFGHFILSLNDESVIYLEKNKEKGKMFTEFLKMENPILRKTGKVARHQKKQGPYKSEHPRIYIDGEILREAGFDIGKAIEVKINVVKKQIIIDLL